MKKKARKELNAKKEAQSPPPPLIKPILETQRV